MLYNNIVSKTKKIIITSCVIGGAILILVACLLLVFLLKPNQGEALKVETVGNHIIVSAQPEEERTYRFRFANGDEVKTFDSTSSQFDITELLWNGELSFGASYQVSYCLIEPTGILAGEFSEEITYVPVMRLDAPVVSLDEQTFSLSWQAVRGADHYIIYYYDGENLIATQVEETNFDLTQIKGGERQVFVTSASNQAFFYESELSNVISATITHTLVEFDSAYIDENYVLHIVTTEQPQGIDISVNGQQYYVGEGDFDISATQTGYEITFSAALFYQPGADIQVSPHPDLYNIFIGESTVVSGPLN